MLDTSQWDFQTELSIPVKPHNKCFADNLRVVLDRPGLARSKDTGEVVLAYSILVEIRSEGEMIASKRSIEVVKDVNAVSPLDGILAVALALFPDSEGNPLQIAR